LASLRVQAQQRHLVISNGGENIVVLGLNLLL
jgi:hypothetical protein